MVSRKASAWEITKKASTAPATNSTEATATKLSAYRRSFAYRPGVMNAHSWYSHTGQASTTPTVVPTFSRSENWSNAPVPSRVHEPSAVKTARDESGSEQYGVLSSSPRFGQPNSAVPNQM